MKITQQHKLTTLLLNLGVAGSFLVLSGCASGPSFSGVSNGDLKPCPSSPNCVSTAEINSHGVASFRLKIAPDQAINAIAAELQSMSRVSIVEQNDRYLRAEFKSALFRFVDDVEFYVRDDGKLAVRSASRVGYSDLGVNRSRVEDLRELFKDKSIIL